MSDIPDGADVNVAQMAIAWEVAKDAMKYAAETRGDAVTKDKGRVDIHLELFNRAYYGLLKKPEGD